MEDLIDHFSEEVSKSLSSLASTDFEDKGLSGLHLKKDPILLKGIWINPNKLQQVTNNLNVVLDRKPVKLRLRDNKTLTINGVDLVSTSSSAVYLTDIVDGTIS